MQIRSLYKTSHNFSSAINTAVKYATAKTPIIPDTHLRSNYSGDSYTGPSYDQISKLRKNNLPSWFMTFYEKPVYITEGKMQYLWDHSGKRYLDAFGGVCTVSVGHCHPYVNAKLKQQVDKLWHTTSIYMQEKIHTYSEKILQNLPREKYNKVLFFNSGSEANDFAMTISKMYTGNEEIVAVRNCYHGGSVGSNKLTSLHTWRPTSTESNVRHTLQPDPYRGIYGGARNGLAKDIYTSACPDPEDAGRMYAQDVRETIAHGTVGKIAGIWIEGIQGVGGTVQYPKGYVKEAYKIAREHGGLCIMDEVQTGWGRTGENFWGWQNHIDTVGDAPDLLVVAKSMGNGFPMSAVITNDKIMDAHSKKIFFNTFGGNPLSMAVGEAVLDTIKSDNLQENCEEIGNMLISGFHELQRKYEIIGDVRGQGLLLGIEIVKDKHTKARATKETVDIFESMKEDGILVGKGGLFGNVLRIKGPMCWNKGDAKFFLESLENGIQKTMRKM